MQASLDYAQSLLHAKDLTEVMRLHSEFVQGQMRTLAEQVPAVAQRHQHRTLLLRGLLEAIGPALAGRGLGWRGR